MLWSIAVSIGLGNVGNPRQDDSCGSPCHLAASPATCCRETFQCASLSLYIASTHEMDRTQGAGYTPLCTVINMCASVLLTHTPCWRGNVPTWGGLLHTTTQVQYSFSFPHSEMRRNCQRGHVHTILVTVKRARRYNCAVYLRALQSRLSAARVSIVLKLSGTESFLPCQPHCKQSPSPVFDLSYEARDVYKYMLSGR